MDWPTLLGALQMEITGNLIHETIHLRKKDGGCTFYHKALRT